MGAPSLANGVSYAPISGAALGLCVRAHDGAESVAAEHIRWWRRNHPTGSPSRCAAEIGASNIRAWDELHDAYAAAWLRMQQG